MRITDKPSVEVQRATEVRGTPTKQQETKSIDGAATVKIGALSTQVVSKNETSAAERAARIQEIAKRIENNHYPVDVRRLAEAMARDEVERGPR
jgi:anti-sigma28 factor (negative regulator of flagellin synthesis)